jgi:hypothetical protein
VTRLPERTDTNAGYVEPPHLVALRENSDNWSSGIYNCAEDPRFVVKGQHGIKYTVNFAHPLQAWTILLGSIGIIAVSTGIPLLLRAPMWVFYGALLVSLTVVFVAHWWLARRHE